MVTYIQGLIIRSSSRPRTELPNESLQDTSPTIISVHQHAVNGLGRYTPLKQCHEHVDQVAEGLASILNQFESERDKSGMFNVSGIQSAKK